MTRSIDRRELLVGAAALLAGCTARPNDGFLGALARINDRAQARLLGRRRLAPSPGPGETTPLDDFPIYHVGPSVPLAPAGWTLEVSGLVSRPVHLTLADLQRMPRTDLRVRHHCVEGWSAVASWHGVRLSELARAVGADARAPFVEFRSFDAAEIGETLEVDAKSHPGEPPMPRLTPYTSSWDRESALHPQTILAYGMNGAPLTPAHGAPLRVYAAVKLGYKMVKYLSAVRFLPRATGGFWEDQGYAWFAGV